MVNNSLINTFARTLSALTAAARETGRRIAKAANALARGRTESPFIDLFKHNPVPMFIYERAGLRIIEGNDAAAMQYGYTHAQFVSMSIHDLVPAEDVWRLQPGHITPHNGGLANVGLRRHKKSDGTLIYVDVLRRDLSFRGRDASLVTTIDVTERINAQRGLQDKAARLQKSQDHLAHAQRLMHVGSDDRDVLTDHREWSEETFRIFGVSPETFVPTTENFLGLVHPDDRPIVTRVRDDITVGTTPEPHEYRIIRPDGAVRTIYRVNEVFYDEAGNPIRVLGTLRDVTEKRAVEARERQQDQHIRALTDELRKSQEHLLLAQGIAQVGSFERDLQKGSVIWSEQLYRLLGRDRASPPVSRDEFLSIVHPADRDAYEANMTMSETGVNASPGEFRIIRPDGAVRWLLMLTNTVCDEQGKPWRRIGTAQDVTERHEAEERRRELERSLRTAKEAAETAKQGVEAANLVLEQRVEERTAQLHLAQAELLTKERLSAIGQLTATVAHELRNPISAIRNTIYAVKQLAGSEDAKLDRPLARMERGIARCEAIIADLLDFTKLRQLSRRRVNLDEWIAEVLDEQRIPENIVLERKFGAPETLVSLDDDRFRRVVINLIENATHALNGANFSDRRITVATSGGAVTEITVEDTGPGIAADVLPKVFEPLFSTKSFGTGLGLPTVKQIVEQHGGTVSIESEVGQGTLVRIRLGEGSFLASAA